MPKPSKSDAINSFTPDRNWIPHGWSDSSFFRTQPLIDNDFPTTARNGLLHILCRLEEQNIIMWNAVVTELRRIGRFHIRFSPGNDWPEVTERLLEKLPSDKVLDFCERLYTVIAQTPPGAQYVGVSKIDLQEHIASELHRLFIEGNLAFEFVKGVV